MPWMPLPSPVDLPATPPSRGRAFTVALLASVGTLAISALLRDVLEPTRFLLLFPAVIVSAWYGGFAAGVASAAVVAIGADLLLIQPSAAGQLTEPAELLRIAVFLGTAAGIAGVSEAGRRARARAEAAAAAAGAAVEELREQKARTELILRSVADGITVQDASGRLLFANDAAARLVGFADGPSLAAAPAARILDAFEILDEEGRPFPLDQLPGRQALAGAEAPERMLRYRRRDGEERWSLVRASPVRAGGEITFAVNVFHDLTERVESARRVAHTAASLERAVERLTALQAITAAVADGRSPESIAEAVTDGGVRALGARTGALALADPETGTLAMVRTRGLPDAAPRERGSFTPDAALLGRVYRTGEPVFVPDPGTAAAFPEVAEMFRESGVAAAAAAPLRAGARVVGAVGFGLPAGRPLDDDVRELVLTLSRQAGQALERAHLFEAERQARAEAEAASSAKSRFLAVMSHELRTPLNAILGYQQLLEEGIVGPVTATQKEQLRRIRVSTRHLLRLIEQILTLSRIEAGRADVRVEEVDVAELAQDAVSLMRPLASGAGLALAVAVPDAPVRARTDPDKLRQILLNLLSNAIKFTSQGGVDVALSTRDRWIDLVVRDTGDGIAPADLERIFDPFVQGSNVLGGPSVGTGLGLAVSRDLARLLGGDILVETGAGAGSAFTVRMPHTPPEAAAELAEGAALLDPEPSRIQA